jgi:glycosyltransferase involved in cell wall biosynthesis
MIEPLNPDYSNTPVSEQRPRFGYAPDENAAFEPVVSVITPFFNTDEVFEETVESVLGQSLQQFEWLIVDDGTTDESSLRILERTAARDSRIRVIRTAKNGGPAAARNLGVRVAQGRYVAFIDSDDLWEPTALEKLCWALEGQPQYSFAGGFSVGFGAKNYLWRKGFHSADEILESNTIVMTSVIRREVYLDVGGMPEASRNGMEDWEFWLRCASRGYWGVTVREFLDWYRRRKSHSDRWSDWDGGAKEQEFRRKMRLLYPDVFQKGVPRIHPTSVKPYPVLPLMQPFANPLRKKRGQKRMLCIFPHLELGGADKFNLDMIGELQANFGYQVTIASTRPAQHRWRHHFESLTSDVFTLDTLLSIDDYARFLQYLIESRDVDTVMISNSQLGYQLAPFLRSLDGDRTLIDYIHMEEENWKSGNFPRYSLNYSTLLDMTIVASNHLKEWMVSRGGDPDRIEVCTINVDANRWSRFGFKQKQLRAKYDVAENLPVISYAARLTDQKQPGALAEVVRLLRDRGARFTCLVAGDGPYWEYLQDYIRRHGLTELRMLGAKSNREVQEILAISDIYFMPSQMEGIALALYEAMSMAVVPVAADVGGQAELVTPECGYLIEHGPNEVLRYVEVLSTLLLDETLRRKLATAGRRRIEQHFQLRQMGKRMACLLEKAMTSARCVPPLKAIGLMTATEAIEQHRMEALADHLWAARNNSSHTVKDSLDNGNGVSADGANDVEYHEYLRGLGAVLKGNAFAVPRLLKGGSCSLVGLAKSLALLYSSGTPAETRGKLRQALESPAGRAALAKNFRPQEYLAKYGDVGSAGLEPLLHYVTRGMAEGRVPSAGSYRSTPVLEEAIQTIRQ